LVEYINNLHFSDEDLSYLKSLDLFSDKFLTFLTLLISTTYVMAQEKSDNKKNKYFTSQADVKGKTAYTEIVINASPEKVRENFLKLDEWPNWNSVIVKIEVLRGDINNISTKPQIDAVLHIDTTKSPQPAPLKLWLTANNEQAFVWEAKNGFLIRVYHTYLFLPAEGGKATKLLHYERMTGFLSLFFSKKLRKNMTERYSLMNEELKQLCEK